jgi:hypothetical protein
MSLLRHYSVAQLSASSFSLRGFIASLASAVFVSIYSGGNRNFWPFVRPQDLIGDRPEPLENPGLLARMQSAAFGSHLTL